ncbi:MAG: hypothetical protein ACI9UU_001519 [Candidatus Azotimanducaceae bacterium]|jgi:hypothetical protein
MQESETTELELDALLARELKSLSEPDLNNSIVAEVDTMIRKSEAALRFRPWIVGLAIVIGIVFSAPSVPAWVEFLQVLSHLGDLRVIVTDWLSSSSALDLASWGSSSVLIVAVLLGSSILGLLLDE